LKKYGAATPVARLIAEFVQFLVPPHAQVEPRLFALRIRLTAFVVHVRLIVSSSLPSELFLQVFKLDPPFYILNMVKIQKESKAKKVSSSPARRLGRVVGECFSLAFASLYLMPYLIHRLRRQIEANSRLKVRLSERDMIKLGVTRYMVTSGEYHQLTSFSRPLVRSVDRSLTTEASSDI
jgi:hypothetical protein